MAVRTAFALGLHRVRDTSTIFDKDQIIVRQNLWRSLFVLDRFLAASLGRPTAISEEDCAEDSLIPPEAMMKGLEGKVADGIGTTSLDAAVNTCQSIGHILKKIYSKRKVTTGLAQSIAGDCEPWMIRLHTEFDAKRLFYGAVCPGEAVAILHVHLLGCHSIILLTRPFFLYLLIRSRGNTQGGGEARDRSQSRLERFGEACIAAAIRTISLVNAAFESDVVPQRNPFIL